jgi:hypothetical protein
MLTIAPLEPHFYLVRTFDLAPLSGRIAQVGQFPGLKTWAESSSPFGRKFPDVTFCKCPKSSVLLLTDLKLFCDRRDQFPDRFLDRANSPNRKCPVVHLAAEINQSSQQEEGPGETYGVRTGEKFKGAHSK